MRRDFSLNFIVIEAVEYCKCIKYTMCDLICDVIDYE